MKWIALLLALWLLAGPFGNAGRAQGCGPQNPNCIVPTAPPGTTNNQAASTAFVGNAVSAISGGGVPITGTPAIGWVPIATSTTTAAWAALPPSGVTNIATTSPITGGPITATGTIGMAASAGAGSYTNVGSMTVDAFGRVTAATTGTAPVTSITAAAPLTGGTITGTGTIGVGNIPVANLNSGTGASVTTFWRGDATWAGAVTSITAAAPLTGGPITTTGTIGLATSGVTAASYTNTNLTVDAFGRITTAANGTGGGTFPPTGCVTTNGVIFNNATPCDTGLTYAGGGGQILAGNGSNVSPSYSFTAATGSGLYFQSALPRIAQATTEVASFSASAGAQGIHLDSLVNGSLYFATSGQIKWAGNTTFLSNPGTATLQHGDLDKDTNALIVAQTIRSQGLLTGGTSNQSGKDFTFIASPGKGTGAGGRFLFQIALAGTTGNTPNPSFPMITLTPAAAATSTIQLGDGTNITTYDSCTGFTSSATGVLACTTSAMRFKSLLPEFPLNLAGLGALRTDIPWKYRENAEYGLDPSRTHIGLFADDVEKLDPRCVTYRDGAVADYEDRCLIAYLIADRKAMKAEIEDLKRGAR